MIASRTDAAIMLREAYKRLDTPHKNFHGGEFQAGADAETAATVNGEGAIAVGATVRVNDTATGKKQAPHIGKTGTVLRQIGPDAWDVSIPREKRGVPLFVCFHTTELEVVA